MGSLSPLNFTLAFHCPLRFTEVSSGWLSAAYRTMKEEPSPGCQCQQSNPVIDVEIAPDKSDESESPTFEELLNMAAAHAAAQPDASINSPKPAKFSNPRTPVTSGPRLSRSRSRGRASSAKGPRKWVLKSNH